MKERPSEVARQILEYGLEADPEKTLDIPADYRNLAREVYDVPERPETFSAMFKEGEPQHTIMMTSGGLDSTVSWLMEYHNTGRPPESYYVNMGQEYAEKEKKALFDMGIPFEEIPVDPPETLHDGKWKHIHPGRNFYYLSLVAEKATVPSRLVLSALDGEITDQGGDKSRVFFNEASRILEQSDVPVTVVTPLEDKTKTDLVLWAKIHGYLHIVKKSISCFSAEEGRCGSCQSCLRTWVAFSNNDEEIDFNVHPMVGASEYVKKYEKVMKEAMDKNDYSHYSTKRIAETWNAFRNYRQKRLL